MGTTWGGSSSAPGSAMAGEAASKGPPTLCFSEGALPPCYSQPLATVPTLAHGSLASVRPEDCAVAVSTHLPSRM